MFNGASTTGTSFLLVQVGSGGVSSSGYLSYSVDSANSKSNFTTGFGVLNGAAANLLYGHLTLTLIGSNTWISSHTTVINQSGVAYTIVGAGAGPALSGALDRIRITTVAGTDTFDAGTANIFYEG